MEHKWGIWSLKKGLKQLTEELENNLRQCSEVEIATDTKVKGLIFTGGKVKVRIGDVLAWDFS